LICYGLNSNLGGFGGFTLIFIHVENRGCLSRGVQVTGAAWRTATRIMSGVGDLVQRITDGCTCWILGGRTIEMSDDAVHRLHRARGDEKRGFLGSASKPRSTVYLWFGLKTTRTVSLGLASKPVSAGFLVCASKQQLQFSDLCLKIIVTVFWFGPQN
jgi:hypothetical protein